MTLKEECRIAANRLTDDDKRRITYLGRLQEIARIFGWNYIVDETARDARKLIHEVVQRPTLTISSPRKEMP
jgi:hypothetical protein